MLFCPDGVVEFGDEGTFALCFTARMRKRGEKQSKTGQEAETIQILLPCLSERTSSALLCYFIVSLDTILAVGSRYPRETDEFGTVFFFFFFRERDVNERASSDAGEAGFNEIRVQRDRVQFYGGGAIRVIPDASKPAAKRAMIRQLFTPFILCLVAIGRSMVSLMIIIAFCTVTGFGSRV